MISQKNESKKLSSRLTALATIAIVNMCNQSDDIKDIFLKKDGFNMIMNLMESKNEDVLLNTLRLVMTLIATSDGDTAKIGTFIAEENDNEILKRLILLIKQGPDINFCDFTPQVLFYAVTLLRAFISHTPEKVKDLIMNERPDDDKKNWLKYPYSVMNHLLDLMKPENIHQIKARQDIEDSILSLFTQLVRDER